MPSTIVNIVSLVFVLKALWLRNEFGLLVMVATWMSSPLKLEKMSK